MWVGEGSSLAIATQYSLSKTLITLTTRDKRSLGMKNSILKKRLIREVGMKSFFLLFMLLFIFSCNPFAPKPEPEPGSRNYTWELDTLYMPMNYISTVWGASPDDVWAMGEGGTEYDRLLHYDGNEWATYTDEIIWCSGSKIFGFAEDDIWMAGGAGWLEHGAGIWHYDGDKWEQFYVYDIEKNHHGIYPIDLWGDSPDNVYVSGVISFYDGTYDCWRGFVLHYDGREWSELVRADFNSQFLMARKKNEDVFIYSYAMNWDTLSTGQLAIDYGDLEFYHINKDSSFQIIASQEEKEVDATCINNVDGEIYFVFDHDVCTYHRNKFTPVFYVDNENFYKHIAGRSINDLFISMKDGIAHYNGKDIEYLYNFPSVGMGLIGEPCILEKDIYYSIRNRGSDAYNLVLHGKLVEE